MPLETPHIAKWPRRRRPRRWPHIRQVLSESLINFFNSDSLMVAASIAYHSLLCIFPFLLLLLGLGGLYIQHFDLTGRLAIVLDRALPMKPDFILQNVQGITRAYGRITLISVALLLWSSSGIFMPVEKALNRAWEVEQERSWWRRRLLALEMAVILGFLILISTGLVGVNVFIHNWLRQRALFLPSPFLEISYHAAIIVVTFSMTLAMFIILFERLPNRPLRFREVLPSALLTALFWEAARSVFTLLLARFSYRHIYGSIGAVVALMTWAYISSVVILFGAQVSSALYRSLYGNLKENSAESARESAEARA